MGMPSDGVADVEHVQMALFTHQNDMHLDIGDDDLMLLISNMTNAAQDSSNIELNYFWKILKPVLGDIHMLETRTLDRMDSVQKSMEEDLHIAMDDAEAIVLKAGFDQWARDDCVTKVDLQMALFSLMNVDMDDLDKLYLFSLTETIETDEGHEDYTFPEFVHLVKDAEDILKMQAPGQEDVMYEQA